MPRPKLPASKINETGPVCDWCGCRPDDPQWAQPTDQARGIACFGCIADMRYLGQRVRVLGRVITSEES